MAENSAAMKLGSRDDVSFIHRLFNQIAGASMIALTGGFFSQIAGSVIAGQLLSGEGLAVVGMATPVYYIFGAAGALLGFGCSVLCSNYIGQSEFDKCRSVFSMTYILTFVLAALLTGLTWLFIDPITSLLGANAQNFALVKQYALTMATGGIGIMLIHPAFNMLRWIGKSRTAAMVFVFSGVLSLVLDYVFLLVLHTGVAGIAAATCIGSGVASLIGAYAILKDSDTFKLTMPKQFWATAKNILVTGTPGAMEYFCFFICMLGMNNLLAASLGSEAIAAYKIVDSINTFALIFIWGVAGPLTPIAGVFNAEHDTKTLRDGLKHGLRVGLWFVVPLMLLLLVFAPQAAGIFGMRGAAMAVRIFALSLPLSLINHIIIYVHSGTKRVLIANTLMAARMAVFVLLCALPLVKLGGPAVWWCFLAAEAATLLMAGCISLWARRSNKLLMPFLLIDTSYETTGRYVSFSVAADGISQASEGIAEFCEENQLSMKASMAIALAIEEMLVVTFAKCHVETVNVRVLALEGNDIVVLRTRCGGTLFNPVSYAQNASEEEKMDVMGINMILKLAVNVDYRSTFGVNNTTIIIHSENKK